MTRRPPGPDRYASGPGHWGSVAGGIAAVCCIAIGITSGPRAGLIAAAFLFGLPIAATLLLVAVIIAHDAARTLRHRAARRRAGVDVYDVAEITDEALTTFAEQLPDGRRR